MNTENKITPELIEQAKKAESVEALLALAKENGIDLTAERAEKLFSEWHTTKELSDDELNSVSGGCGKDSTICPACGSTDVELDKTPRSGYNNIDTRTAEPNYGSHAEVCWYVCKSCKAVWTP